MFFCSFRQSFQGVFFHIFQHFDTYTGSARFVQTPCDCAEGCFLKCQTMLSFMASTTLAISFSPTHGPAGMQRPRLKRSSLTPFTYDGHFENTGWRCMGFQRWRLSMLCRSRLRRMASGFPQESASLTLSYGLSVMAQSQKLLSNSGPGFSWRLIPSTPEKSSRYRSCTWR